MWCPRCKSEYREKVSRCTSCDVALVAEDPGVDYPMDRGPLTGRSIEDELETTGPALAGTFVTMEEAQAALRALSDAGITAEIVNRDDQFPTTISRYEPAFGVTVPATDTPKAREILKTVGLLPTAVARFRRAEEAQAVVVALEARSIKARISALVLDEIPAEFRDDMDPYSIEVPADQESAAMEVLESLGIRNCPSCGAQLQKDDSLCRACGEAVAV
jgi:predicted RNA-binding Zn-ribbon protein involved in translation (DUF1610 family)